MEKENKVMIRILSVLKINIGSVFFNEDLICYI